MEARICKRIYDFLNNEINSYSPIYDSDLQHYKILVCCTPWVNIQNFLINIEPEYFFFEKPYPFEGIFISKTTIQVIVNEESISISDLPEVQRIFIQSLIELFEKDLRRFIVPRYASSSAAFHCVA